MIAFKTGAEMVAPKVSLRRLLHRELAGFEQDRTMDNVHASSVTAEDPSRKFCARAYALWTIKPPEKHSRFLSTALSMTFDIGRRVEDIVRETMEDYLVGDWQCPSCNQMHEFLTRPLCCSKCKLPGRLLEYREIRFVCQESGISCGVDMLFNEGTGKLRVVESKSIDKDLGKALVAPNAEHRLRTSLYLRIIENSNHPMKDQIWTDEGVVLYTSKGGYGYADPEVKTWGFPDDGFSPFKEYRVKRNDASTDVYIARGKQVKEWREQWNLQLDSDSHEADLELPGRICKTSLDSRARTCSLCQACFAVGN